MNRNSEGASNHALEQTGHPTGFVLGTGGSGEWHFLKPLVPFLAVFSPLGVAL